jgi:hypothetical protein
MSAGHKKKNEQSRLRLVFRLLRTLALITSIASCSKREPANNNVTQKTFASPAAAGEALFDAAKTGD